MKICPVVISSDRRESRDLRITVVPRSLGYARDDRDGGRLGCGGRMEDYGEEKAIYIL